MSGPAEEWLDVVGFGGAYRVSNTGRIFSNKVQRIMVPYLCRDGYYYIHLRVGNPSRGKSFAIHRLVAIAFLGAPTAERREVNHKNADKVDNRVQNLEWMSPKENSRHASLIGRTQSGDRHYTRRHPEWRATGDRCGARKYPERVCRGEAHPTSKLKASDVAEIRLLLGSVTMTSLAERFGVCLQSISNIRKGKTWRPVTFLPVDLLPSEQEAA